LGFVIAKEVYENYIEYLKSIVSKWVNEWERSRVYEANPKPGVSKYFLTAAFMYPNGPAHIGHARTYVIPDIIARFKRSMGINVLFPMGFHYTGTPILVTAERIASNDIKLIKRLSESFGVSEDILRKLNDPLKLARYFHEVSKEAMKDFGLSIDWRREFTTIDPEFKSFIRWQFKKLKDKGLLIKGTYPVGWCPVHNMPVGMHDTENDVEPEIGELTIIKFINKDFDAYLPIATLRPETVLGVTNVWVNPDTKYCIASVEVSNNTEKWVLSCEAAKRLSFQRRVSIIKEIPVSKLLKSSALNPVTSVKVRVLPAKFVNPKYGTGVVMSVPAHAPYDYAALMDYVGTNNHEFSRKSVLTQGSRCQASRWPLVNSSAPQKPFAIAQRAVAL